MRLKQTRLLFLRFGSVLFLAVLLFTLISSFIAPARAASATAIPLVALLGEKIKGAGCETKYERINGLGLAQEKNRVGPLIRADDYYASIEYHTPEAGLNFIGNSLYADFLNKQNITQLEQYEQLDTIVVPAFSKAPLNDAIYRLTIGGSTNCSYKMVAYPPKDFLTSPKSTHEWPLFSSADMFTDIDVDGGGTPAKVKYGTEVGSVTIDPSGTVTNVKLHFEWNKTIDNALYSTTKAPTISNIDNVSDYKTWLTGLQGGGGGGDGTTPPPSPSITEGINKITIGTFHYYSAGQINIHIEGTALYGDKSFLLGADGKGIDLPLYDSNVLPTDHKHEYRTKFGNCEPTILNLGSQADEILNKPKSYYPLNDAERFFAQIPSTSLKDAPISSSCVTLIDTDNQVGTRVTRLPPPDGVSPGFRGWSVDNPIVNETYRRSQYRFYYSNPDTIQELSNGQWHYNKVAVPFTVGNGQPVYSHNGNACDTEKNVFVVGNTAKPWVIHEWKYDSGSNSCSIYTATDTFQFILSAADAAVDGGPAVDANPTNDPPPGTNTDTGLGGDSCESDGGALGWIECPLVKIVSNSINLINNWIQEQLKADVPAGSQPVLKSVWVRMRDLAYIILVPIMLVMVIGTAINVGPFDAYTVKKALPRMVMGVLFIALSWYFCLFAINVTNAVGNGVQGLIEQPFTSSVSNRCPSSQGITLACLFDGGLESATIEWLGLAVAAAGTLLLLAFFYPVILMFMAIIFGTIILRRIFILALLIVSPLAILPWIFPMNNKLWKAWWDAFTRLLIVYPLIMILITMGHVFALLIDTADSGGSVNFLIKLIAYILPLVFIPAAFKFAGGAFATITGMANDKSKGFFGNQKKRRADKFHRLQHSKFMKTAPPGSRRQKINDALMIGGNANKLGFKPGRWGGEIHKMHRMHDIQQRDEFLQSKDNIAAGDDEWNISAAMSNNREQMRQNLRQFKMASNPNYAGSHDEEADLQLWEDARKTMSIKALQSAGLFGAARGGTVLGRSDKGNINWELLAGQIADGDNSVLADIAGKIRPILTQAGQPTLGGVSHGTAMAIALSGQTGYRHTVDENDNVINTGELVAGGYGHDEANRDTRRASLKQQGGGSLVRPGIKLDEIRQTQAVMREDAIDAREAVAATESDPTATAEQQAKAKTQLLTAYAQMDQMLGSLNYASPEQLEVMQPMFAEEVEIADMPEYMKNLLKNAPVMQERNEVQYSYRDPANGKVETRTRVDVTPRTSGKVTQSQILDALHGTDDFHTISKQFEKENAAYAAVQAADAAARAEGGALGGAAPRPPAGT